MSSVRRALAATVCPDSSRRQRGARVRTTEDVGGPGVGLRGVASIGRGVGRDAVR